MSAFLLGLVVGFNLAWVFMSFSRDGYWREFNARRRGSNPPTSRKPAVPYGPAGMAAQVLRAHLLKVEQVRRAWTDPCLGEPWPEDCKPEQQGNVALDHEVSEDELARRISERDLYGWGAGQFPPPTPAPGKRREYLWSPSQMAECGGPCWEARDPRRCTCGALWRDVPIRLDEGRVQRGGFGSGPTTPKPLIKPQPTGGRQIPPLL